MYIVTVFSTFAGGDPVGSSRRCFIHVKTRMIGLPWARTTTYGQRSFSVSVPSLWNFWQSVTTRTGSVSVVTDCQKFSYFLPVTYQIDIRTVKFLQKFQSSDNHICNLFSKKAEIGVKNIFSQYGSQIHNVYDVKNFFENTFFGNDP